MGQPKPPDRQPQASTAGQHPEQRLGQAERMGNLPPEWPEDLLSSIQAQLRSDGRKLVVVDDDPTGTQTVHGIPVLTEWPVDALYHELTQPISEASAFYLLTNSRSYPLVEARAINREIGGNLRAASQATGRDFAVVSRSDSTLRGHFPGEVQALADALGGDYDAWLIIPFFEEGGRYTIDDIHYVAEDGWLVPAGETPYAHDATFGYEASNLRQWVAEKTEGWVAAADVGSISIDTIRNGGPDAVAEELLALSDSPQPEGGRMCVVNAASMRDMEVVVLGLLAAEAQGRRFLYRTAASFVRVRAGIAPRPLLSRQELGVRPGEPTVGLVVVGSYVPKSTRQVAHLVEQPGVVSVEVDVHRLLDDSQQAKEIERVADKANAALAGGGLSQGSAAEHDVAVFTSRNLVTGDDAATNLAIGQRVSESLVAVVRRISTRPSYLVAKGGITSSDVATDGLDVKRAMVMGQILPGVPVWELGAESRYPGLPYVVFPGNVGDVDALTEVRRIMRGEISSTS